MMVDPTTDDARDKESRIKMKRKADIEEALLKDVIGPKKITFVENGHLGETNYDDTDLFAGSWTGKGMN